MYKLLIIFWLMLISSVSVGQTIDCPKPSFFSWPLWKTFQEAMVSEEGRVIDKSDPRQITTSEGQSYALFFALVNNDPQQFKRLVRWTENNLAQGDLTAHLPAWLWGRNEDGSWGVLDPNTASDSNLWIAYSLLEAGRLWSQRRYTVLGHLLLQRMAIEEVVDLPQFGAMLLPGKQGFEHDGHWLLNPSYVPPQLIQRAQYEFNEGVWAQLLENTPSFLMQTAPLGIAPDWVSWGPTGWGSNKIDKQIGSYDAIRVYLWIGMLHDGAAYTAELKKHFSQVLAYVDQGAIPAEELQILDGQVSGQGPVGFSAALLPLFDNTPFGESQRERIKNTDSTQLGYYNQVLVLFGQGWDEKRYFFDPQGRLIPAWEGCK